MWMLNVQIVTSHWYMWSVPCVILDILISLYYSADTICVSTHDNELKEAGDDNLQLVQNYMWHIFTHYI